MNLLDFIPHGEKNAISAAELSKLNGRSTRFNRQSVLILRKSGVPVCSTERGYYLPENDSETRAYIHSQLSRIGNGYAALRPFRALLKREAERANGQMSIFDYIQEQEKAAVGATNTDDGKENV